MKKIIAIICGICLLAVSFSFTACSSKSESKVMNVSLNPEVEFILDANDKVISVNALNEEGNIVINGQAFVGKSSEKALELYVSICKETGFLVTGSAKDGENEISVSFSGEDAAKYYEQAKADLEKIFSKENITATVAKGKELTEEYIAALLAECAPYIDEAKLATLDYMEKIEAIAESRKETAQMYSQELKNAYYQAKEDAFNHAKFEAAKSKVDALNAITLEAALSVYDIACSTIETARKTLLVDATSPYQISLVAFREAKTAYLNFRNYLAQNSDAPEAEQAKYEQAKTTLEEAEKKLLEAGKAANEALNEAKEKLTSAYNKVVDVLNKVSISMNDLIDSSEEAINTALTNAETKFSQDYATAISSAKDCWNSMKEQLKNGYAPKEA